MSLINDALKKAQKTDREASNRRPVDRPLLPIVEAPAGLKAGRRLMPIATPIILLLTCGLLLYQWRSSRLPEPSRGTEQTLARPPVPVVTAAPLLAQAPIAVPLPYSEPRPEVHPLVRRTPAAEPSAPAPRAEVQVALAAPVTRTAAPKLVREVRTERATPRTTESAKVVAAQTVSQPAPPLRLERVYYRLKKPSVRINGRTLALGDRIAGAKIVSIERYSVHVRVDGQTQVLEL